MVDVHSHVLPDIDDGARSLTESLMMIKEAKSAGFTSIICTSHYLSDTYSYDKTQRQLLINELQSELDKEGIDVALYNGAETYISMELDTLISQDVIPTLNNSRYVLFELPMNTKVLYQDVAINKLFSAGLIPILAHPERYTYMQTDFSSYTELIRRGVLFQVNLGSIVGRHGNAAKKVAKKLLKSDMVSFLATDSHRAQSTYANTGEMLKKLGKIIDKDKIELLTKTNPEHILKNEEV